mmetsp:Transcript_21508/g.38015  ORF Transcript_21508/g.38015 Transcript_21508/m.38015 type:complete len:89 (-) Transcript_21508:55-321(-)
MVAYHLSLRRNIVRHESRVMTNIEDPDRGMDGPSRLTRDMAEATKLTMEKKVAVSTGKVGLSTEQAELVTGEKFPSPCGCLRKPRRKT